MEDIIIVEYHDKYSDDIVQHIRDVAINEFGYDDWEDYLSEMEFEDYKNEENKFWIALNSKEEIVGTIGALKMSETEVYLNSLYVNKNYRRLGLAKKLYSTLYSFVLQQGYKSIILKTFFRFTNAIKFYEKLGFVRYEENEESCFYKKDL